jgi:hypothetical protein
MSTFLLTEWHALELMSLIFVVQRSWCENQNVLSIEYLFVKTGVAASSRAAWSATAHLARQENALTDRQVFFLLCVSNSNPQLLWFVKSLCCPVPVTHNMSLERVHIPVGSSARISPVSPDCVASTPLEGSPRDEKVSFHCPRAQLSLCYIVSAFRQMCVEW